MLNNRSIIIFLAIVFVSLIVMTGCSGNGDSKRTEEDVDNRPVRFELVMGQDCRLKVTWENTEYEISDIDNIPIVYWFELSIQDKEKDIFFWDRIYDVTIYDESGIPVFASTRTDEYIPNRQPESVKISITEPYHVDLGQVLSVYEGWSAGTYFVQTSIEYAIGSIDGEICRTSWTIPIVIHP